MFCMDFQFVSLSDFPPLCHPPSASGQLSPVHWESCPYGSVCEMSSLYVELSRVFEKKVVTDLTLAKASLPCFVLRNMRHAETWDKLKALFWERSLGFPMPCQKAKDLSKFEELKWGFQNRKWESMVEPSAASSITHRVLHMYLIIFPKVKTSWKL